MVDLTFSLSPRCYDMVHVLIHSLSRWGCVGGSADGCFLCGSEQEEVQCLWRGGGAHFQVISVEKQLVLF